jgi:hypothetical protein
LPKRRLSCIYLGRNNRYGVNGSEPYFDVGKDQRGHIEGVVL